MVAFITSILIGIIGALAVVWYGKTRRAPGAPLTWGEANVAAAYAFFMMFWWFGVVPHQWLTLADNELNWRPDRAMVGIGGIIRPQAEGGWFPFTITYLHVRDLIAMGIYSIAVGLLVAVSAWWNNRKKNADAAAAELSTSAYGRPLVKRG